MYSNIRTSLLSLIYLCLLTACGSGGGSEDAPGGLNQLSYTKLPSFSKTNENETVTLSLGVSGQGSQNLSYVWEVQFQGEDLKFSGQNTDTISFVAPEVTGNKPISVRVSFDLNAGTLLGQTSDFTSITIIDLDPVPEPSELGKITSLPEVEALSLDVLANDSTWHFVHFETAIIDINKIESRINLSNQRIAYLTRDESNTLNVEFCGLDISRVFDADSFGSSLSCEVGDPQLKFYQNASGFRMEVSCSNSTVFASEYTKISDSRRSDFGRLAIDFDFRENINLSENICGTTTTSQVISPATSPKPLQVTNSAIQIFGEYLNEPLNVVMNIDGPIEFGLSFFNDIFDPNNVNSVTINASVLPALDGLKIDEDGDITLMTSSITDIEGNFDADLIDLVGAEESIDGEFELRFE